MPPLKNIAAAAATSNACFTNIPRLSVPCNYVDFLKTLLKEKHNKKVFLRSGKEVVDQCFRLQASKQFKLDKAQLMRALAEVGFDIHVVCACAKHLPA